MDTDDPHTAGGADETFELAPLPTELHFDDDDGPSGHDVAEGFGGEGLLELGELGGGGGVNVDGGGSGGMSASAAGLEPDHGLAGGSDEALGSQESRRGALSGPSEAAAGFELATHSSNGGGGLSAEGKAAASISNEGSATAIPIAVDIGEEFVGDGAVGVATSASEAGSSAVPAVTAGTDTGQGPSTGTSSTHFSTSTTGVPDALTPNTNRALSPKDVPDVTHRPKVVPSENNDAKASRRQEKGEDDIGSTFSSPLSELPDLPNHDPLSPLSPTSPSPPLRAAPMLLHPPQLFLSPETSLRSLNSAHQAESSAARKVPAKASKGKGEKRKAPAQGLKDGGKVKAAKTSGTSKIAAKSKMSATGTAKAKAKAKANGMGEGYSQEDAIDIDGAEEVDSDGADGDYNTGAKAKGKKTIIRRGPKKAVQEFFGRSRSLRHPAADHDEEDGEASSAARASRTALRTARDESPYESPEPIEHKPPPRPTASTSASASPLPNAPGPSAVNATSTSSGHITTRAGATLAPMKPPERKLGTKLKAYNEAQVKNMLRGRTTERQIGTCLKPRYAKWGKCTQCVAKNGGDTCRFRDFRVFPIDPISTDIIGPGYFKPYKLNEEMTPLPTEFNVPFDEQYILRTEKTVAPILLPLITRELRHIVKNKAIKREVDAAKHRSVCDFCQSTIFAGYFFCRLCGKDYCLSCERFFSDSAETMDKSPWHIFDAARPRLMHCSARAGKAGGAGLEPGPRTYGNDDADDDAQSQDQVQAGVEGKMVHADGFLTASATVPSSSIGQAPNGTAARGVKRKKDGSATPADSAPGTPSVDAPGDLPTPTLKAQSLQGTISTNARAPVANPRRQIKWHFRPDLQPVSRFDEAEMKRHWLDLAGYGVRGEEADWSALFGLGDLDEVEPGATREDGREVGNGIDNGKTELKDLIEGIETLRRHLEELAASAQKEQQDLVQRAAPAESTGSPSKDNGHLAAPSTLDGPDVSSLYTTLTHPSAPLPPDPADLHAHSHTFIRIPVNQLDNGTFDALWSRGEPMVVDGINERLKERWDPDGMIEMFGQEECGVTDCETDMAWASTVKDFFEAFKDEKGRGGQILKLKDWPATEDFKTTHPTLYNDFSNALPVPTYTRREGALNLYAHFPPGSSRPDIGPKMYNAFAAREGKGGKGSTRLHMDVADAINVMLYASDLDILGEKGRGKEKVDEGEGERVEVDLTGDDGEADRKSKGDEVDYEKAKTDGGDVTAATQGSANTDGPDALTVPPDSRLDPVARTPLAQASPMPHQPTETSTEPDPPRSPTPIKTATTSPRPASAAPLEESTAKPGPEQQKPPGQPGCAVWDIFRAQDADKIRAYLTKKFGKKHVFVDPIHAQMFYLDAGMRRELWERHGVVGHRIYQYPGQAVFIPAGCAHQVCNMADCIKIALDFVSPQNVRRCQQLTQDFRNENFVKAWKEDVLQLYNILWFAWMSARETRNRPQRATEARAHADSLSARPNGRTVDRSVLSSIRDEAPRNGHADSSSSNGSSEHLDTEETEQRRAKIQAEQDILVNRLIEAALAAPDPAPPPEARAPSAATGSRWAQAKAASMAAVTSARRVGTPVPSGAGRTSSVGSTAPVKQSNSRTASAPTPSAQSSVPASAQVQGQGQGRSGFQRERFSDAIRNGTLGMSAAFNTVLSEMGAGGAMDVVSTDGEFSTGLLAEMGRNVVAESGERNGGEPSAKRPRPDIAGTVAVAEGSPAEVAGIAGASAQSATPVEMDEAAAHAQVDVDMAS